MSLGFFGLWPTLSVELRAHMLGDSLIRHENTIYIYNQKSTRFGAVYMPLPGRWYPTVGEYGMKDLSEACPYHIARHGYATTASM